MRSWEERDLTDAVTWVDVDQEVRIEHGYEQPRARPAAVEALCHRDGRIREAALAAAPATPELLPLVVIRTADWVAPVRERTRALRTGPHPYGAG